MGVRTLKSFLYRVFLFLLLIFVLDRGIGTLFVLMKDLGLKNNPENVWLKTPFAVEKVETDVVIIGSSKASHHYVSQMMMDSLSMSVYNCGQDGCFFLYQNCLINMILERYKPRMIIWDIQPESFNELLPIQEYQNFRYLSPYYNNIRWAKSYIDGESTMMRYKMMSKSFAYNSKILNYIFPLLFSVNMERNNGYLPLQGEGILPKISGETIDEKFVSFDQHLMLLENTIQRCIDNDICLCVFVSPVYSDKNIAVVSAVSDIQCITQKYNVVFQDYTYSSKFLQRPEFFKDISHLNASGAEFFTDIILKEIKDHMSL